MTSTDRLRSFAGSSHAAELAPFTPFVTSRLDDDRGLELCAVYEAPRHALFAALTTASAVGTWLPDPGVSTVEGLSIDGRVGGAYGYDCRSVRSGRRSRVTGIFRAFDVGRSFDALELRETSRGLRERVVRCSLTPRSTRTELALSLTFETRAARDFEMLCGAEAAAIDALARMEGARDVWCTLARRTGALVDALRLATKFEAEAGAGLSSAPMVLAEARARAGALSAT